MSDLQQILRMIEGLDAGERAQLARALAPAARPDLPLFQGPRPHSTAWLKAERGHAVLATETSGPGSAIPPGAAAVEGMWRGRADAVPAGGGRIAGGYAGPALLGTDVCVDLALGLPEAAALFREGRVEPRLATATYLELLAAAANEEEQRRLQRFVAPLAVLSLGPMASSRSVDLLLQQRGAGLQPLEALAAATAIAHEIPLVTRRREPFAGIPDLQVLQAY